MESNPAPLPQSASLWDSQSWRGKEACPAEVTTAIQGAGQVWTQVGSVCANTRYSGSPVTSPQCLALPSSEVSAQILELCFLALTHIPMWPDMLVSEALFLCS